MKIKYLGHGHTDSYFSSELPSRLFKGDEVTFPATPDGAKAAERILKDHPDTFEPMDSEAQALAKKLSVVAAAPAAPTVDRAVKAPSRRG